MKFNDIIFMRSKIFW